MPAPATDNAAAAADSAADNGRGEALEAAEMGGVGV